jgi:hypothetical protein
MARGMHRHRNIRLTNLRAHKKATRLRKGPSKVKARALRDTNIIAKIKATAPGTGFSSEIQSWLSRQLDKPFSKITADDIKLAIAE